MIFSLLWVSRMIFSVHWVLYKRKKKKWPSLQKSMYTEYMRNARCFPILTESKTFYLTIIIWKSKQKFSFLCTFNWIITKSGWSKLSRASSRLGFPLSSPHQLYLSGKTTLSMHFLPTVFFNCWHWVLCNYQMLYKDSSAVLEQTSFTKPAFKCLHGFNFLVSTQAKSS